jgi:hypothetical protein
MTTKNHIIASILVLITSVLALINYWSDIAGPHLAESIVSGFSVLSLAVLGLIILKNFKWMKWILLVILIFELLNLIEVIRFRSTLSLIISSAQMVLHICAVFFLFFIRDINKQGPHLDILTEK